VFFFLTLFYQIIKLERKRIRRSAREERRNEQRDKISLGLLPPPEPKLKLANFMKVRATCTTCTTYSVHRGACIVCSCDSAETRLILLWHRQKMKEFAFVFIFFLDLAHACIPLCCILYSFPPFEIKVILVLPYTIFIRIPPLSGTGGSSGGGPVENGAESDGASGGARHQPRNAQPGIQERVRVYEGVGVCVAARGEMSWLSFISDFSFSHSTLFFSFFFVLSLLPLCLFSPLGESLILPYDATFRREN